MKWRDLVLCLVLLSLTGCGLLPAGGSRAIATQPGEVILSQTRTVTSPAAAGTPLQILPPTETLETMTPPVTRPAALHYRIHARLDYDRHTLEVAQVIRGQSPSSTPLSEVPLVIEPARTSGVFTLTGLTGRGGSALTGHTLTGVLLRIPFDPPLQPSVEFEIGLSYTLSLPQSASWLGYTARQLNLGDWFPFLPAYQEGKGWLTHEPGPAGEYLVYPSADFTVGLELLPSAQSLIVAASAPPVRVEGSTYTYSLDGARSFAFSVSPYFEVSTDAGVTAYTFAEHRSAARAALTAAREAQELYSEQFGPYPYPGLALVEGDFFDGMEYSGLFFLGAEYFAAYSGDPQTYLTPLSAHETAHQWWYSQVGNDPALEPWLDEALCAYAELVFYEKYHPDLVGWWWFYRVKRYVPEGWVGSAIYDHPYGFRPYVNAVYLRGILFLDDLRALMGADAFFGFLRAYTARGNGQVVTSADFFETLRAHTTQDVGALVAQYFGPDWPGYPSVSR